MTPDTSVTLERDGAVTLVTLRRPPHNLLTEPELRALADVLHSEEHGARVAVIASEGKSFCAGANFRSDEAPDPADGAGFERQTAAFYRQAQRVFASPIPMIAAVQGAAIGAGFGLALACDIRVVGARAWFQANFVRLGIHPGFALSRTLPDTVGPGLAAELFLTGRRIDSQEALTCGIAQHRVDQGEETSTALELARKIASGAPLALASTLATLREGRADLAARAMEHELAEQVALAGTADAIEGVAAMLEGREPRFSGG